MKRNQTIRSPRRSTWRALRGWRSAFHHLVLPSLRGVDPSQADAILTRLGRWLVAMRPGLRSRLREGLEHAKFAWQTDWNLDRLEPALAGGLARFLARDGLLDLDDDRVVLDRFEVEGDSGLRQLIGQQSGAIILGSHYGGHIATLHWLYRQRFPILPLVQRPHHISGYLNSRFDGSQNHSAQGGLFLKREMSRAKSAEVVLRARIALREGMLLYLNGDILWDGPSTYPGRLLGYERSFLATWADLAALTGAPVIPVFANHLPGGRYRLGFDRPLQIQPGEQGEWVREYLARLELAILRRPDDAPAHLSWPCYIEPPAVSSTTQTSRFKLTRRHRMPVAPYQHPTIG